MDDIQLLLTNAKNFYRVKFISITKLNIFFYFSIRKIPMNGVMQMNYQNIFIQK
jgi:threonine/homoserine efflux transporter RhtA